MRKELTFVGAKADPDGIDRTNYYAINDKARGSSRMNADLYNAVAKNPGAAYKYFQYIYGNRDDKGKVTANRSRQFDDDEATRLATAAGMKPYHKSSQFIDDNPVTAKLLPRDTWESLKTFYENGFDANGNLRKKFRYTTNGYDGNFDGGTYTVSVNDGKAVNAQDDWNIDLGGHDFGMNANRGRGIPMIVRWTKFGGKLLDYIYKRHG